MKTKTTESIPGVFVIESNELEDERKGRQEGAVLKAMLELAERPVHYHYIRTHAELKVMLRLFQKSRFRYLHLACHGSNSGFALTLDNVSFKQMSTLLAPVMDKRQRLFLSVCSATRRKLAEPLFEKRKCLSVIGPRKDICFSDAAIVWASFYTRMSNVDDRRMKNAVMKCELGRICRLFDVRFNAFFRKQGKAELVVLPQKKRR